MLTGCKDRAGGAKFLLAKPRIVQCKTFPSCALYDLCEKSTHVSAPAEFGTIKVFDSPAMNGTYFFVQVFQLCRSTPPSNTVSVCRVAAVLRCRLDAWVALDGR